MDLLQELEQSPLSVAIAESSSLFPWLESLHVLAIVLVVGSITIVDLRLLGLPAHTQGVERLIRQLLPLTWGAFTLAVISGGLMFISSAQQYAGNLAFQIKMALILAAGLNMAFFHALARRSIGRWDEAIIAPAADRIAGAVSLSLWASVVVFGRWIGFTL